MHKNKRKLGFTLAELIAVVIIVGLMATFAVGYYKRSVEQSRFSEGLMMANAVAEAINRRNEENHLSGTDTTCKFKYNIKSLDIEVQPCGPGAGDFCGQSRYFQILMTNNGVEAQRLNGPYKNAVYTIRITPHCASSNADRVACVGKGSGTGPNKGRDFCQSMGYTQCSGTICVKP